MITNLLKLQGTECYSEAIYFVYTKSVLSITFAGVL